MKIHVHVLCVYIAHYIAKVVAEEEKERKEAQTQQTPPVTIYMKIPCHMYGNYSPVGIGCN